MSTSPANQTPQQAAPGQDFPSKTLGIVGLVVAIVANLIGLIISAIALNQSKKAGYKNTPALAGVIVGAILLALGIIFGIIGVAAGLSAATMTTY